MIPFRISKNPFLIGLIFLIGILIVFVKPIFYGYVTASMTKDIVKYLEGYYSEKGYYPNEQEFQEYVDKNESFPVHIEFAYNESAFDFFQTYGVIYKLPFLYRWIGSPGTIGKEKFDEWHLYYIGHSFSSCLTRGACSYGYKGKSMSSDMFVFGKMMANDGSLGDTWVINKGQIIIFEENDLNVVFDPSFFDRLDIPNFKALRDHSSRDSFALKAKKTGNSSIWYERHFKSSLPGGSFDKKVQLNVRVIDDVLQETPKPDKISAPSKF